MFELIDTHCHLSEPPILGAVEGVLSRAREQGVAAVVAVAYDRASWDVAGREASAPGVFAAYGLHPWVLGGEAGEHLDRQELEEALDRPAAVAVGEIGLDFAIRGCHRRAQLEALRVQLEVARDRSLPVVLHCRGAFEPLLEMIADVGRGRTRGVVHAYSRSPELGQRFLDLGLLLGFGGTITNPRARRARQSAAELPLERIVLETDAPSIGVGALPAAEVEPCHVLDVARALAEIRGVDLETIARRTTDNARELFRLG